MARRTAHVLVDGASAQFAVRARMVRMIPMPLSEEERKSLEELERGLAASDPELALQLQSGRPRGAFTRTILGGLAVVAGFAMVIAGIITQWVILGVLGFLLASAGAYWLVSKSSLQRRFKRHDGEPVP
ncbi:DUF3040 domain-containing protein [Paenarthrobacter sp. NPDC056912]|uniref:DUF3040 domain-containing protein n=1 Tax=Paenarthrobacter sp. NPDC056912 TaxID=3345965 RepID=UPI00366FDC6F